MSKFFISDTHFGHNNIIRYSNRPYIQTGDLTPDGEWTSKYHARDAGRRMDDAMTFNWNETVSPEDEVTHLGDWNMGGMGQAIGYLRRLNFKKLNFIWGNHDNGMGQLYDNIRFYPDLQDKINFLGNLAEVNIEGQRIVLCHYAMRVWNKSHAGSWHLYGHSHGSLADDPHSLSFDVGVDCHNLRPISFERVRELMAKKHYVPIDHHGQPRIGESGVGLTKEEYAKAERKRQYEQLKKEFSGESN